MATILKVTQHSINAKYAAIEELEAKKAHTMEDMNEAKSQGDLRENFGYQAAKKQLQMLDSQIAEAAALLDAGQFEIVEPATWTKEERKIIILGTYVVYEHSENKKLPDRERYLIGGGLDDHESIIRYTSPAAQALIGHQAGDKFTATINGHKRDFHVLEVRTPKREEIKQFYPVAPTVLRSR
jgi:transcription elongation factor GreA